MAEDHIASVFEDDLVKLEGSGAGRTLDIVEYQARGANDGIGVKFQFGAFISFTQVSLPVERRIVHELRYIRNIFEGDIAVALHIVGDGSVGSAVAARADMRPGILFILRFYDLQRQIAAYHYIRASANLRHTGTSAVSAAKDTVDAASYKSVLRFNKNVCISAYYAV